MTINIRHIRQVDALARHRNFARAAQELGMTQPGLSRAIKSLENVLDVILFDRNNREITPTVYGQHILDFGKALPVTCKGINSEYSLVSLARYSISPAINILRQTVLETVANMKDGL